MRRQFAFVFLAALLALSLTAAAQTPADPLRAAVAWLKTQQQTDGGFSNGYTAGSDPATTADAVAGIGAAGEDASGWASGGSSPLDFLRAAIASGAVAGPGAAAKVALAVVGAGEDPRSFGGVNLVDEILKGLSSETGLFGSGPYDSALAIRALAAAAEPVPEEAVAALLGTRLADGTYSFNGDQAPGAGDSNTTAMAVLALIAADAREEIGPSVAYFRTAQNEDGGWTYQKPSAFGEATDANSTALVIQTLIAAGEDLAAWNDPDRALLALQLPSGAFTFQAAESTENLLATVQALPALAGLFPAQPAGQPSWLAFGLAAVGVSAVSVVLVWIFGRRRRAAGARSA